MPAIDRLANNLLCYAFFCGLIFMLEVLVCESSGDDEMGLRNAMYFKVVVGPNRPLSSAVARVVSMQGVRTAHRCLLPLSTLQSRDLSNCAAEELAGGYRMIASSDSKTEPLEVLCLIAWQVALGPSELTASRRSQAV